MKLKDFDELCKRDFDNGAVLDEIRQVFKEHDELLEACEAVMQMYEDDSMFRHPRNCDAILKTEQAIAKVKGK